MRGAYDEVACFNQNCHSIFTTSKVDQILYHSKDFFPRGPVYGCNKCCLAVTQALASKEIEIAPPTICQICAGVNGNQTILQLFANGEQVIWLCPNCVELQYPTLQSNFYLIQHSVPQRESIPFFTYDLPTEPPKKRALSPSGDEASPPFKKRLTRIPLSNQGPLPWESSLSAAVNQQERIYAALEQLQILQNQQQLNLKNIQTNISAFSDFDSLRDSNAALTEQFGILSKNIQNFEDRKTLAQQTVDQIREILNNFTAEQSSQVLNLLDHLQDAINPPSVPIFSPSN